MRLRINPELSTQTSDLATVGTAPSVGRGAGFLHRYGLSWHSPEDGYKMMAQCLRGWHAVKV
jgi:hypothetical protein